MEHNRLERVVKKAVEGAMAGEFMSLEVAVGLIQQIEEKAREMGLAVVTAVSDASGRPIVVHCMDGAFHGSFDVALHKAYTSTAFQMSTENLSRLCQPGGEFYGLQFSNQGQVMILGGGEPLMAGEVMVGGLGVSGATAAQDSELAAYGKAILKKQYEKAI